MRVRHLLLPRDDRPVRRQDRRAEAPDAGDGLGRRGCHADPDDSRDRADQRRGVPGLRSGFGSFRAGARFRGMPRRRARTAFDRRQAANGACRQDGADMRRLLASGAMAVTASATRKGIAPNGRLARLLERMPRKKAAIAVADKMARMIWAVVARRRNTGGIRSSTLDDATWNGIRRGRPRPRRIAGSSETAYGATDRMVGFGRTTLLHRTETSPWRCSGPGAKRAITARDQDA